MIMATMEYTREARCLDCKYFKEENGYCKCTIDNESIRWYQYACLYYEDKREEANTEKKGL